MHRRGKVTPSVRDGKVQRKNRHTLTPYWRETGAPVEIRQERAGRGYRHVVRRSDVEQFLELIDDWEKVSAGLDGILIACGEDGVDGWYQEGIIGLCAWSRELTVEWSEDHYEEHAEILERLAVPVSRGTSWVQCDFSAATARDYTLLHVFLHELGHHRDRMTTKSKRSFARGEGYAEDFAILNESVLWERYCRVFGAG